MKLFSLEFIYIFCLSLPVLSEVIRKYLWFNNAVYMVSDAILLAAGIFVLVRLRHFHMVYSLLIGAYVSWAVLPYFFHDHSVTLISVGIRPLLIPYMCMIIAFALFNTENFKSA